MTKPAQKETLQKLADAGHQIVMTKPDPARVAIPYLLFLSAHPNNLIRYQSLLSNKSTLGKRLYNFAAHIALTARSIKAGIMNSNGELAGDPINEEVDILFISHFLRPSDASQSTDLYYGTTPGDLEEQGIKTCSALINHAKTPWSQLKLIWKSNKAPRTILPGILDLETERKLSRQLQNTIEDLKADQENESDQFLKAVRAHAIIDAASPSARTAMRIGEQVRELVKKLKPKILITTYEGHSWERLAYANARAVNPDIYCIGYHHAVLFPMQSAMLRPLGKSYDPDVVFTAGDITRDYFEKNSKIENIAIKTFGSCRGADDNQIAEAPVSNNHCLVLPEGLISESLTLSKFAISAAKANPRTTFTIRLHPLITPNMLSDADREMKTLPANVSWSHKNLEEDCKAARWALYRGSSAIITAVLYGVQPLYLAEEPDEIQIDPINTMLAWRAIITSPDEFTNHVTTDLSALDATRKTEYLNARNYCKSYFTRPEPDLLTSILKQLKSNNPHQQEK